MNSLPAIPRERSFRPFTTQPLDLLIIGGGIVGAGIARDAAMRGLRVGLVEQHDFAFGTSGRSSRLLHGGLRYLAQGRIGLVREASIEKKIIHHIAPHLAEPLAFVFPTYSNNHDWKLWQLKVGVKIYDLLCGGINLGKSTWLNKNETLLHVPGLTGKNLNGAVRYYDGFTNDARLVLDTLRSAAKSGAALLNHAKFENADFVSGNWEAEVSDKLSLEKHKIRARAVVNATGPWADGLPHSDVKLRLTKGIHLVVERNRLPVPDAIVMTDGKRILFVIPWGERTIVGTTDTDYTGSLDDVRANVEDIHYVLQITNQFFPNAKLTEQNVISTWAGLRPLIADPNGKPSDISRSHDIKSPEPFWWDVAGGKLTTYRLMAEQAVDQIVKKLSGNFSACRTATESLLSKSEAEGISGIAPPQFSRSAVEHFCAEEWALNLDDVMIRRTSWHYYFRDAAERAEKVADWMAEILGWSENEKESQLRLYKNSGNAELLKSSSTSSMALSPK
ncbi:MAG: glycerol-3-phosphate dehydrogenase/oxidase [Verrucomicrobiota bacterium]